MRKNPAVDYLALLRNDSDGKTAREQLLANLAELATQAVHEPVQASDVAELLESHFLMQGSAQKTSWSGIQDAKRENTTPT